MTDPKKILSAVTAAAVAREVKRTSLEVLEQAGTPQAQQEQAAEWIDRQLYQDPPLQSWRVWGGVWSGLTAVLILPEVQAAIGALVGVVLPPVYVPIATAVLGALWPIISKRRDQRPVRAD